MHVAYVVRAHGSFSFFFHILNICYQLTWIFINELTVLCYYRYNESALVVHLKSGMKEALGIFETSFVESIRASLPTSEVQIRSM